MKTHSIRAIHPEYLRSRAEASASSELGTKKHYPVIAAISVTAVLFLTWSSLSLSSRLTALVTEMEGQKAETVRVFKEYDALHQAIVEKLKRHSELLKGTEPSVGEVTPQPNTHGIVTVPKANVRGTPSPNGDVLMTIPAGSRLLIEGILGEWFKVMTPLGTSGYLSRDVFKEAP